MFFSGQHVKLLDDVIKDLGLIPRVESTWLSRTEPGPNYDWRSNFRSGLGTLWNSTRPAAVCVVGDTDTVRIAAEVASRNDIPIVHVEAGIRHAGQYASPEPEEFNRRAISKLAALHLAPTVTEAQHLYTEGIPRGDVAIIGDLSHCAIACAWRARVGRTVRSPLGPSSISLNHRPYALCSFHRSTSLSDQSSLLKHFLDTVRTFHEIDFILIERIDTRWSQFYAQLASVSNVRLVEPLSPSECLGALLQSSLVITDSAGLQQEALLLGKRAIACRREVELQAGHKFLHIVQPPFSNLLEVVGLCIVTAGTHQLGPNVTAINSTAMTTVATAVQQIEYRW